MSLEEVINRRIQRGARYVGTSHGLPTVEYLDRLFDPSKVGSAPDSINVRKIFPGTGRADHLISTSMGTMGHKDVIEEFIGTGGSRVLIKSRIPYRRMGT